MAEGVFSSDILYPSSPMDPVDLPCRICTRQVYQYGKLSGRYYGLLENCDHPFCLMCIRNFVIRRVKNCVRERIENPEWENIICPVCSTPSSCIMASRELTPQGELKTLKFQVFKEVVSEFLCPFMRQGFGFCFCIGENHSNTSSILF